MGGRVNLLIFCAIGFSPQILDSEGYIECMCVCECVCARVHACVIKCKGQCFKCHVCHMMVSKLKKNDQSGV